MTLPACFVYLTHGGVDFEREIGGEALVLGQYSTDDLQAGDFNALDEPRRCFSALEENEN